MDQITQMLEQSGAVLLRNRKHKIWQLPNGKKFTQASTPSDWRAEQNALSDLKRIIGHATNEPECTKTNSPPGIDMSADVKLSIPDVTAKIRTITPEQAGKWLNNNTTNRHLSEKVAGQYARDMMMGRWKMNGEPIILSSDGRLLDGQHRLRAVIISEKSIKMLVVSGVIEDAFDTIDIGKKRNFADVLKIKGHANTNILASAINWMMRFLTPGGFRDGLRFTQAEQDDALSQNPGIIDSVKLCGNHFYTLRKLVTPALSSSLHYLFAKKDRELASIFFDSLETGSDLKHTDPVYVLRQKLIHNASYIRKLPQNSVAALIIKSWNATVNSKTIRLLNFKSTEEFPEIQGCIKQ